MNNNFRLFGSVSKTEELDDGTIKVYGVASSGARDHAGEIVRPEAMKAALPDYSKFPALREMHEPKAAGRVLEASVDEDGFTNIVAHVVDPVAVQKVKAQVYPAFSIGGKVLERDSADKSVISALRLVEISLVDSPCNPDAALTMWKADVMSDYVPTGDEVVARAKKLAESAGTKKFRDFLFEAREELIAEDMLAKGSLVEPTTNDPAVADTDPAAEPTAATDGGPDAKQAADQADPDQDDHSGEGDLEPAATNAEGDIKAAADAGEPVTDPAGALATALADALEKAKDGGKKDEPYGDVEYADPGYQDDGKKRYPLDSEEHIRAAWNYIHQSKNADKYSADQLSEIKGKIEAAWKAKIDADGPPSAEKMAPFADLAKTATALKAIGFDVSKATGDGGGAVANKAFADALGLTKGLYTLGYLAQLLDQLVSLQSCSEFEEEIEGDDSSVVPSQLAECARQLGQALINMAQEEVAEAIQAIGDNDVAIEIVDCDDDGIVLLANTLVDLTKADEDLMAKAGARNSKADQEHLQAAHDSLAKAGAVCDPGNCPDDADKAAALTADNERLAKALTDALPQVRELADALDTAKSEIAELRKRFEDEPLPPKTAGPAALRAVEKAQDSAGTAAGATGGMPTFTKEDFEKMLADLPEEQRGMAMIKFAQMFPQAIKESFRLPPQAAA